MKRQQWRNPTTGLAVIGPLARSAEDLELAFDIASGPDQGEQVAWRLEIPPARHARLSDFRVAVLPPISWLPVDEDIVAAQDRLATGLGRLGAHVQVIQPEAFGDVREYYRLYHKLMVVQMSPGMSKETRQQIAEWGHKTAHERGDEFMEIGAQALEASAHEYVHAFWGRERFRLACRDFFRDWDVLLTPVTFTLAFRHSDAPPGVDRDDLTLTVNGQAVRYGFLQCTPAWRRCAANLRPRSRSATRATACRLACRRLALTWKIVRPLRFAALVAQEFGGYQTPPGYV